MKSTRMLTILILGTGLIVCVTRVGEAVPMGTAFTYQGRLFDANNPTDGIYDFEFLLYNAPSDGNQTASKVEINNLDVIDGYFTVELDFGSDVFSGETRWLEIGIRPGEFDDPCEYIPLSPRTELTPVPYALHTQGIVVGMRKLFRLRQHLRISQHISGKRGRV
jgi:hypothetical protein